MCHDAKNRFLIAYSELLQVAPAARKARISRQSIYRWRRDDPTFKGRMAAAWREGYQRWQREVYEPAEQLRQAARERRKAELKPARQQHAARMRRRKQQLLGQR